MSRIARPVALPVVDLARCTGCGWCVAACPPHVLSLQVVEWKKRATLDDAGRCTGCAKCAVRCPFGVIAMVRTVGGRELHYSQDWMSAGTSE
jgi:Fe-S-cluster-containing hydrogenase component 2